MGRCTKSIETWTIVNLVRLDYEASRALLRLVSKGSTVDPVFSNVLTDEIGVLPVLVKIFDRCWSVIALSIFAVVTFADVTHSNESWTIGDIRIEQAWARFGISNVPLGAVYLTVHNNSNEMDYLVAATSPTARSSAIYEVKSVQGNKRLVPIPGGLNLGGHREIIMRPDGIQLILTELRQVPEPGQTVPLQLIFLNAGKLNLEVPVHPLNAEFPPIVHKGHKQ